MNTIRTGAAIIAMLMALPAAALQVTVCKEGYALEGELYSSKRKITAALEERPAGEVRVAITADASDERLKELEAVVAELGRSLSPDSPVSRNAPCPLMDSDY